MIRCPHCEYPIPDDRERIGARCPSCHDPLYEPPLRFVRACREGEASCALHPGMESVSVCARCNRHLCETCRTRWRNVVICATCADKALASGEAAPIVSSTRRQAKMGLLFAAGAWLVAGLALTGLWLFASDSDAGVIMTMLSLALLFAAVPLAAVGAGQATAALRATEGGGRITASAGLLLGGLYVGVVLGIGTLSLWQN